MAGHKGWPEPSKPAKIIGVLFTGLYVLMLAYLVLLHFTGHAGAVALPIVVLGLAVGIAYLAGRVNPMVRIVPSVLWIVVVIISFVSPGGGDSTQGGAAKVLCAVVLMCALAYHVYVDVKVLLARSRAEAGGFH